MLNMYLISKGLITKRLKIFIIKIIIMNINIDRLEPYNIFNYVTSPRKMSYENWLKSPVMEAADTTDDVYFKKVCFKNGDYYTHKHFILDFYQDLIDTLHRNGLNIQDENGQPLVLTKTLSSNPYNVVLGDNLRSCSVEDSHGAGLCFSTKAKQRSRNHVATAMTGVDWDDVDLANKFHVTEFTYNGRLRKMVRLPVMM